MIRKLKNRAAPDGFTAVGRSVRENRAPVYGKSAMLCDGAREKIVGVYSLLPTRPATMELVNIAVDESEQHKGYGKALIQHAIETARREGYQTIEVGTGNSSIGQLALYQKCGFRITHIDRDFFYAIMRNRFLKTVFNVWIW